MEEESINIGYNFKNIKSNYILKKIFNQLEEKTSLEIIKYSKTIQKRLNKDINDYKKYNQIEIEIIPIEKGDKNRFINFLETNLKEYYHIYFNDKKEEISRNYFTKNEKVRKIYVKIDYKIRSLKNLFQYCSCIEKINFIKFIRKDIIDMSHMFENCESLSQLNLMNFKTNKVINMECMFRGCTSLKELNVNNFDTSNVTNMSNMFHRCKSLEKLNLNNFDTSNVTNMSYMFFLCISLYELDLRNFITNNVTDISYMFVGCGKLKNLYLYNFNTSSVTNINGMLYECPISLVNKIISMNGSIPQEAFDYDGHFCYW